MVMIVKVIVIVIVIGCPNYNRYHGYHWMDFGIGALRSGCAVCFISHSTNFYMGCIQIQIVIFGFIMTHL
jgi:hypothetical protein